MNQEIPKAPETEKQGEYIPLNLSQDFRKKSADIDKTVATTKGSPDQATIEQRAAEAKNSLQSATQDALRKAKGNQQNTIGKINLLA